MDAEDSGFALFASSVVAVAPAPAPCVEELAEAGRRTARVRVLGWQYPRSRDSFASVAVSGDDIISWAASAPAYQRHSSAGVEQTSGPTPGLPKIAATPAKKQKPVKAPVAKDMAAIEARRQEKVREKNKRHNANKKLKKLLEKQQQEQASPEAAASAAPPAAAVPQCSA
eukprot:m51a1_g9100 hypothetical protein (170) ;mRNA; r:75861-76419